MKKLISIIIAASVLMSINYPIKAAGNETIEVTEYLNATWDSDSYYGKKLIGGESAPTSSSYWGSSFVFQNWFEDNASEFVKDPTGIREGNVIKTTVTQSDFFSASLNIKDGTMKSIISKDENYIYFATDIYIPGDYNGNCCLTWFSAPNSQAIGKFYINASQGIKAHYSTGCLAAAASEMYEKWITLGFMADKTNKKLTYYVNGEPIDGACDINGVWDGSINFGSKCMYLNNFSGRTSDYNIYFDNFRICSVPMISMDVKKGDIPNLIEDADITYDNVMGGTGKSKIVWENNTNAINEDTVIYGSVGYIPVIAKIKAAASGNMIVKEYLNAAWDKESYKDRVLEGTSGLNSVSFWGNIGGFQNWYESDASVFTEDPSGLKDGYCIKTNVGKNNYFSAAFKLINDDIKQEITSDENLLYMSTDVYIPKGFNGECNLTWYGTPNSKNVIGNFHFSCNDGIKVQNGLGATAKSRDEMIEQWHTLGILVDKKSKKVSYYVNGNAVADAENLDCAWDGTFNGQQLVYLNNFKNRTDDFIIYFDNFTIYSVPRVEVSIHKGEIPNLPQKMNWITDNVAGAAVSEKFLEWDDFDSYSEGIKAVKGKIDTKIPIRAKITVLDIITKYVNEAGREITGKIDNGVYLEVYDLKQPVYLAIGIYEDDRLIAVNGKDTTIGRDKVGFSQSELPANYSSCTIRGFLWDAGMTMIPLKSIDAFGTLEVFMAPIGVSGDGSANNPFTNFEDVLQYAGSLGNDRMALSVNMLPGEYEIDNTIQITGYSDITFKGNGNVTISGGKTANVSDMLKVTDETVLSKLPKNAKENVLQISLKDLGISSVGEQEVLGTGRYTIKKYYTDANLNGSPTVMCDGNMMTLARWPNNGYGSIEKVTDEGAVISNWSDENKGSDDYIGSEDRVLRGAEFEIPAEKATLWKNAENAWVYGLWKYDWQDLSTPVASVSSNSITTKYDLISGVNDSSAQQGGKFYIYNLIEELDTPGEWYIDRTQNTLYFWPPEGAKKINISLTNGLVSLIHSENIIFEGISFENSTGLGISTHNSTMININNCNFKNIYDYAVNLPSVCDSSVTNCEFSFLSSGGITVGGKKGVLETGNNIVSNCKIHDYALKNKMYNPAIYIGGTGAMITNNEIYNAPHNAIIITGNNHLIEYNNIYNVCNATNDAGAVYCGKSWVQRGNTIRNNYFHDICGDDKLGALHGVYLDDFFSGTIIESNIFENITGVNSSAIAGGGRSTEIKNNIFIDCLHMIRVNGFSTFNRDASKALKVWNDTNGYGVLNDSVQNNLAIYKSIYGDDFIDYKEVSGDEAIENLKYNITYAGSVMKNNVLYKTDNFKYSGQKPRFAKVDTSPYAYTEEPNATLSDLKWSYEPPQYIESEIGFKDESSKNYVLLDNSVIYVYYPDFIAPEFDKISAINK